MTEELVERVAEVLCAGKVLLCIEDARDLARAALAAVAPPLAAERC